MAKFGKVPQASKFKASGTFLLFQVSNSGLYPDFSNISIKIITSLKPTFSLIFSGILYSASAIPISLSKAIYSQQTQPYLYKLNSVSHIFPFHRTPLGSLCSPHSSIPLYAPHAEVNCQISQRILIIIKSQPEYLSLISGWLPIYFIFLS